MSGLSLAATDPEGNRGGGGAGGPRERNIFGSSWLPWFPSCVEECGAP